MTDVIAPARPVARAELPYFYFYMALVCTAIGLLGFLPTYWTPMAAGTLDEAPIIHVHAAIFFAWSVYLAFQTWLAASGRLARHRAVGLIGVSLATAMVIFGVLASIFTIHARMESGNAAAGLRSGLIALTNIGLFAFLVIGALINIRRPEWHKRLILMASMVILAAPIARWIIYYLHAPPPQANWVFFPLASLPLLYDWRVRKRPHPAYLLGFGSIVAVVLLRPLFGRTEAWRVTAEWLSGLAA